LYYDFRIVASPEHGSDDAMNRTRKRRRVVTVAIDRPQALNASNKFMVGDITAMQAADVQQQGALVFLEKRPPRFLGR
jgi:hypothetical protein